jgi:lipopolysaccharide/colanic/teichoic acid biosynthesis glycosyltransferase
MVSGAMAGAVGGMRHAEPRSVGTRFVDVVGAATGIVLLWPLLLAVAVLTEIESHCVAHRMLRLDLAILLQTLGKVVSSPTRPGAVPPQVHPWRSQRGATSGLACETGISTDD